MGDKVKVKQPKEYIKKILQLVIYIIIAWFGLFTLIYDEILIL